MARESKQHRLGGAVDTPGVDLQRPSASSPPMKIRLVSASFLSALPFTLGAAEVSAASAGWQAQTLGQAVGYMILFSLIGILAAIGGYKLFDKCTPGDLHNEIVQHKNVAAAIVAGSVILGVCIIIAAAMLG